MIDKISMIIHDGTPGNNGHFCALYARQMTKEMIKIHPYTSMDLSKISTYSAHVMLMDSLLTFITKLTIHHLYPRTIISFMLWQMRDLALKPCTLSIRLSVNGTILYSLVEMIICHAFICFGSNNDTNDNISTNNPVRHILAT